MKSCLQPLYVRACQPNTTTLNEALKDSIAATIHLLQNQKPKLIPFDHKVPQKYLPEVLWAWIDNTAGQAALSKGYGRDKRVNRLLSMLWSFLTAKGVEPFWRRVTSSANISDPISRDDTTIAVDQKWTRIDGDHKKIYATLASGLSSLEKALANSQKLLTLGCSLPGCDHMAVVP